ncbi:pilus assembly protein Flp/PilA [Kribbella orskensis]|uniref:Pilus assembly protein Flp/PilA n=1 Tax=Kribbella orskensis TaxID=2512216 RepID=A0ABY2B6W6_9ACTN|nr:MULTISPECIES: Flp family type IVb pilin [Kribbella]TCN29169.1 pilus assembly protein Flp/PilA [Kribbella sp. VKM Ac-2500]TCO09072.1 pilus assembly protein Flp/PilA [Kribbella orskensis]
MLNLAGFVKTLAGKVMRDDRGATLIEYGLVAALIVLVVVPTVIILGPLVAALYTGVIGAF